MKIQHVRPFFTGLLCWVLAAGVVLLSLVQGASLRHLIGAAILAALGAVELWFAFSHKSIEEEMGVKADERTLFIATKSGHMALRILNGLLFAGAMLALLGYGFTKDALWMAVALTLCTVVVVMFAVLLAVNCYYEKKF